MFKRTKELKKNVSRRSNGAKTKPLRIGFVPLVDCAPLLVADTLGLFAKYGLEIALSREIGWATIKDKLVYHELDAAHALGAMTLGLKLGLNSLPCNVFTPFVFNQHGNAITLSVELWKQGVRDVATLKQLIRSSRQRRLTFAVVSLISTHHFLLRNWLLSGGINPDKDVRIVVLPPIQMAASLRVGLINGYCVGEPWNANALIENSGWCVVSSRDIAPGHPEKVLLARNECAVDRHAEMILLIQALSEACCFCQDAVHRKDLVDILFHSGYFNIPKAALEYSLLESSKQPGSFPQHNGDIHVFYGGETNVPTLDKARWVASEMSKHGLLPPDLGELPAGMLSNIWREDLYFEALKNSGKASKSGLVKANSKAVIVQ
jgi:NitT/TauT family transport system ATP-binding protein